MRFSTFIFWACSFLILYTYFFYPIILFVAYCLVQLQRDIDYLSRRSDRRVRLNEEQELPGITMIVPVYNEEDHLAEKVRNIAETNYPADRVQVIFVSDGSTDRSNQILSRINQARVEVILKERGGKPTALNLAVERAKNPILVFSDGSTLFEGNAIRKLVRHFSNPKVGAVCGALKFAANDESQQTEGVYWKYESMLRLMESRLGATLTASGAIYALRHDAWIPLSPNTVLDDLVTTLNVRKQGYRVLYDPEAVALDFAASSVTGEFARRVRIAMGSFRSLGEFLRASLPGFTLIAFVSHKLMRWFIPILFLAIFFSNAFLIHQRFYQAVFILQIAFYMWAAAGFIFQAQLRRIRFALIGYFLLAMNLAFLVGLYRCFTTRKGVTWQRVS